MRPHSGQDFVRALKQSSEATPFGVSKLELAKSVWDDPTFQLPNKAEVIAEWLLAQFSKYKEYEFSAWILLYNVLDASMSRPWVSPLVQNAGVNKIATQVLSRISLDRSISASKETLESVFHTLAILWDFSAHRIPLENQLECFGSFLQVLIQLPRPIPPSVVRYSISLTKTVRHAFKYSPNKKKNSSLFLEKYYTTWVTALSTPEMKKDTIWVEIYAVGTDFMFALDYLRTELDLSVTHTIFSSMKTASNSQNFSPSPLLSEIFSSYIAVLRSHKSILFPNQDIESLQKAGIRFFSSACELIVTFGSSPSILWCARLELVMVLDAQQLLRVSSDVLTSLLQKLLEDATAHEWFADSRRDPLLGFVNILLRARPELVLSHLPQFFVGILRMADESTTTEEFLALSLEYYCKTRNLKGYAQSLFDSISIWGQGNSNAMKVEGLTLLKLWIWESGHFHRLRRSIPSYLSPSQVTQYVKAIHTSLQDMLSKACPVLVHTNPKKPEKKRRRIHNGPEATCDDVDIHRVVLACEISCHLLSSLPPLPEATLFETRAAVFALKDSITSFLDYFLDGDRPHHLSAQILLMAALRLNYLLFISSPLKSSAIVSPPQFERLCDLVSPTIRSSGFLLEAARTLLSTAVHDHHNRFPEVVEKLLDLLEMSQSPSGTSAPDQEREGLVGSLLHMLFQRWATPLDEMATQTQISRFVRLVLRCYSIEREATATILHNIPRSASFWELPNFRLAIVATIVNEMTTSLDKTSDLDANHPEFVSAARTFTFVAYMPCENLPKHAYSTLVDRLFSGTLKSCSLGDTSLRYSLRRSLSRLLVSVPSLTLNNDISLEVFKGFLEEESDIDPQLLEVSLGVIETILKNLISNSRQNPLDDAIQYLADSLTRDIPSQLVFRSVGVLANSLSLLKPPVLRGIEPSLRKLYHALLHVLPPIVQAALRRESANPEVSLEGWQNALKIHKILEIDSLSPDLVFGPQLVQYCVSTRDPDAQRAFATGTMGILIQESYILHSGYSSILVLYLVCCKPRGPEDAMLSLFFGSLSLSEYQTVLSYLSEAIHDIKINRLASLVHLASIGLNSHPQGSMAILQSFFTTFLSAFADLDALTTMHVLWVLELISSHCAERPASIRTVDLDPLWALLVRTLTGSQLHDEQTCPHIFSHIIQIISGLIRLRRDLVLRSLPQLSLALRLLLSTLRQPRSSLGKRQLSMIADQLPRWVNIADPLRLDVAQSLSRLFQLLSTKTMIRGASSEDSRRPESLARPFARHAPCVIKAYVDIMNDPIGFLSFETRRALLPGLFELCNVMGTHGRDSLMVSAFDSGGMTMMRSLWSEFEKQRYVGKE